VKIIAHRGASHEAPENTLAAVQLAWEQGADAVEVDVQFSKDGHVVVIHDANTHKTAGLNKKVSNQTLAELRSLDAGRWKGKRWVGQKIPTLEEVLVTIPADKRLFVEIKCGPECIPAFARTVKHTGIRSNQVVPIGFSLVTMKLVKERLPEWEVCWVAQFRRIWPMGSWIPTADRLIQQARQTGLDGLDLDAGGPINAGFVQQVKAAGLELYVWTVDTPGRARSLLAAGIDGLTTNRPGWLRRQLTGKQG